MEEILHHQGCIKLCKWCNIYHINWGSQPSTEWPLWEATPFCWAYFLGLGIPQIVLLPKDFPWIPDAPSTRLATPNTVHVKSYDRGPRKHTIQTPWKPQVRYDWKTRGKEYVLTLERLPNQRIHCYMGNPSKLPYICIKFDSPQVGNSMIPSIVSSFLWRIF